MNGPQKPPRQASDDAGGRTLWQINWNDQDEEPVVTMVDISNIELKEGDTFNPQVSMDEETGNIMVFEQNAQELEGKMKTEGSIYKKGSNAVDLSPEKSYVGQRYLVRSRSDSDLELYSPNPTRSDCCARVRWCCLSCGTREFWRHYWWIPMCIFFAAAIYVLIVFAIMKSLLSW